MRTDELNSWSLEGVKVPRSRRIPITAWPQGSGLPRQVSGLVQSWDIVTGFDGTGTRFVLRLAGPPAARGILERRLPWGTGELMTAQDVLQRVESLRPALTGPGNGVTVAGAEPLWQAGFSSAVLHLCREAGLHTALVTSGQSGSLVSDLMLSEVDLFVVDFVVDPTACGPGTALRRTGWPAADTLRFLERLAVLKRQVRVRLSVVKGLTDTAANLEDIAKYLGALSNLQAVEIYSRPLDEPADVESVRTTLRRLGLPVTDGSSRSLAHETDSTYSST
jgi:pyruvate formate lyase activating enzyme